jgi:carboxypeptidase C (cathepsin A)
MLSGVIVFSFLILQCSIANCVAYTRSALVDQVKELPGATSSLLSNHFSGFLSIGNGKFIHYVHIESEREPNVDSVVFWTNGGPGCSGLLGLFTEMGPWRPTRDLVLVRNPFSWTTVSNMVFLEQPVGVGFSYKTKEQLAFNDFRASNDNLLSIKAFFEKFPEKQRLGFYIASESYGGHYIPQWALQVLDDATLRHNFKGILVGNPFTSFASGTIAMANVLWGLQLIPKPAWWVTC